MLRLLSKLSQLNRRWVFLLMTLAILVPLLFNIRSRFYVDKATQDLFNVVDRIPPGEKAVMISFDYDPAAQPELDPMARAVLRHCFKKHIPAVGFALVAQGGAIGEQIMTEVAREYGMKSGTDYCYFGYLPGGSIPMLYIGESTKKAMPQDYYHVPFDSLPMMSKIHNYDNVGLVLSLSASTFPYSWMIFAGTKHKVKIGAGQTAVNAPENYPFLQTGQICGQMGGMKGAAEYEQLLMDAGYTTRTDMAAKAMSAVSYSHLLIIFLIILGNVGFFAARRLGKK